MAVTVSNEMIKLLALANGLNLPDSRLDSVRRQYESYLQQLERLDAFELDRGAEPATTFTLAREESVSETLPPTKR